MKLSKFSHVASAGIVAFSLANFISILPASAQTNTGADSTTGTGSTTTDYRDRGDSFDWGWLGLIGLAGLAGLGGKSRNDNVTTSYRDPNVR